MDQSPLHLFASNFLLGPCHMGPLFDYRTFFSIMNEFAKVQHNIYLSELTDSYGCV